MVGPRETVSVILTLLSRHEQVVLDRTSAAIGHDVEEPLRSIDGDVHGSSRWPVLPVAHLLDHLSVIRAILHNPAEGCRQSAAGGTAGCAPSRAQQPTLRIRRQASNPSKPGSRTSRTTSKQTLIAEMPQTPRR
jgi:hypothetical protein